MNLLPINAAMLHILLDINSVLSCVCVCGGASFDHKSPVSQSSNLAAMSFKTSALSITVG